MTGLKICGTGSYLPAHVVDNVAFEKIVETSDEWITTRTGIKSRHIADGDTTWSMGYEAARRALESAEISAGDVDLILATTVTADYITPSLSCVIQGLLGAKNAACIDLNCACAGFVYALDMAHRYLQGGDIKTVLIVSSEMLSRCTNYEDRATCVLFGDGAGAAVVRAADAPFASVLGADGTGAHLMFGKNPEPKNPFSSAPLTANAISESPLGIGNFFMDGKEVYKFATHAMPEALRRSCEKAGVTVESLDWVIPHQANIRIVQTSMKNLKLPMERALINIDHTGNTSSATIPVMLDEAARDGRLRRGQLLGMAGFGAGLIYAGAVMEY